MRYFKCTFIKQTVNNPTNSYILAEMYKNKASVKDPSGQDIRFLNSDKFNSYDQYLDTIKSSKEMRDAYWMAGIAIKPPENASQSEKNIYDERRAQEATQVAISMLPALVAHVAGKTINNQATSTATNLVSRQSTANSYYKTLGWDDAKIASHMSGIDFSKPVEIVTLPKGTKVVQYQIPGNPVGGYFAPVGTSAESLGISSAGRNPIIYKTTENISVLRTTAADTSKSTNLPESARGTGGGVQFFTNNRNVFKPLGK